MEKSSPLRDPGWASVLASEMDKPYMRDLSSFLRRQKQAGKTIYPPMGCLFSALNETPYDRLKVVILGQDPYHGEGQAHGLCFSVNPGVDIPPSLRNIFQEIKNELGIDQPPHGFLTWWAKQGVLLLNATLTVEAGRPGSHQGQGWEEFTDHIIQVINESKTNIVFMLWGSSAQKKGRIIDRKRHLVLEAPHPSPLSAYRGFFGCGHFLKANEYLLSHAMQPIDWQLPPMEFVQAESLTFADPQHLMGQIKPS